MQVEFISMDPRIANIHYKDYRKKVRQHRAEREAKARAEITEGNKRRVAAYKTISQLEKEDMIAMESYRAMAQGHRIINVANAIRGAGLNPTQRLPVLALARCHWEYCYVRIDDAHNQLLFSKDNWVRRAWRSNAAKPFEDMKAQVAFSRDLLGAELTDANWRKNNNFPSMGGGVRAAVPAVPAHLRPAGDLSEYHILFEAKWEKHAPPDPLLLKHVAGQMYVVLAQWDLTPIEKAVLEGRFA